MLHETQLTEKACILNSSDYIVIEKMKIKKLAMHACIHTLQGPLI